MKEISKPYNLFGRQGRRPWTHCRERWSSGGAWSSEKPAAETIGRAGRSSPRRKKTVEVFYCACIAGILQQIFARAEGPIVLLRKTALCASALLPIPPGLIAANVGPPAGFLGSRLIQYIYVLYVLSPAMST
jgi:hypothetical protein